MKPEHVQQLKKLTGNAKAFEDAIITLLTASKDPLTFEELYECCGENPPIFIPPITIYNIAFRSLMEQKIGSPENILKLLDYAKSKNVLNAYWFMGACLAIGSGLEQNEPEALKHFLYYYNETVKQDRLGAIRNVSVEIARLYAKKGEYQAALKYFLEYYTHSQIEKDKKDKIFPEILNVYFRMYEDNLYEGINLILRNFNFSWDSLNWNIVWDYIDLHKNDYLTTPKKAGMARLLFLFPPNHAKKLEADKLAIGILQNFLNSLYPLAGNISQSLPVKKDHIPVTRKKKGWDFDIGGTGLDGYDHRLLAEEIVNLEKAHSEYEHYKRRHKELEKQLKEAQEEGYISSARERISNEFSANRVKKVDAKTALKEAEQKLDAIQFAARRKEMEREYKVQRRFFAPTRNRNPQTKAIAQQLQSNRLMTEDPQSLQLTQIPARRVITAERSTIESSLYSMGLSKFSSRDQLGWIDQRSETVMLGETAVQYYQNPGDYPNHLGNYFLTIPGMRNGDYDEILPFMHKVAQTTKDHTHKENEIKLAKLLLGYAQSGMSITTEQLKAININLTDEDCRRFNNICYHVMVKEIARRMPCSDPKYDFPSAIVQARAIKLIESGFLTLEDVFDANAPYGVVTGKKLYNNHDLLVVLKINRVNRLYNEKIYGVQHAVPLTPYLEEHPKGQFIASQKLLRKELQEAYGAAEDSDGEGYSSDDESINQPPRP